jgi:hypothetical protein
MPIPRSSKECPICGYEFPRISRPIQWVAILLLALSVFYLIF